MIAASPMLCDKDWLSPSQVFLGPVLSDSVSLCPYKTLKAHEWDSVSGMCLLQTLVTLGVFMVILQTALARAAYSFDGLRLYSRADIFFLGHTSAIPLHSPPSSWDLQIFVKPQVDESKTCRPISAQFM